MGPGRSGRDAPGPGRDGREVVHGARRAGLPETVYGQGRAAGDCLRAGPYASFRRVSSQGSTRPSPRTGRRHIGWTAKR